MEYKNLVVNIYEYINRQIEQNLYIHCLFFTAFWSFSLISIT